MEQTVTTLTIDRAKWLNGHYESNYVNEDSLLRNINGRMCCLGFYARACGLKARDITNLAMPSQIPNNLLPDEMTWLVTPPPGARSGDTSVSSHSYPSHEAAKLMAANDDTIANTGEVITAKEREAQIKELFAAQNIRVKFTGRYRVRPKRAKQ